MHQLSSDGSSMETLTVTSYDHGIADLAALRDGRTVVVAVKDTPFLHLYDAHELQVTLFAVLRIAWVPHWLLCHGLND